LGEAIVKYAKGSGLSPLHSDELQAFFDSGAFEDMFDFCRDQLGEGEYRNFLERTLETQQTPNALHELVVQFPVPAILTSNYDRLLETAIAHTRNQLPRVMTADDTQTLWRHFAKDEFFLLKVHGDIVRPNTVVLTSRDYTKHVFGNLPFMTFLQRVILSRSILFVGTSLQDIYMKRILEETTYMTGGVGMPHFAILPNPGSIWTRLPRDRYNITVIGYASDGRNHSEAVAGILRRIDNAIIDSS
jgi:hypothetical protein